MDGMEIPAIDGCPECGELHFEADEMSKELVSLGLDGHGGVAHVTPGVPEEVKYTRLECTTCGETLIEDGEPAHDALK